jgi:type VI secretion system secreted protein VgrG
MASAGLSNWFQNVSITQTTNTTLPRGWPADNPYQSNFFDTLVSGMGTGLLQGLIQTYLANAIREVRLNHQDGYANSFVAVPWDARVFKIVPGPDGTKPRVYGPQLAVVVGDQGVKVVPDKGPYKRGEGLGRVRVRFPWQRYVPFPPHAVAKEGETSSTEPMKSDRRTCWVDVSSGWAGRGFGTQFMPRIGEEVIVSFLDGDPDRPIIMGRRYNADHGHSNMPFPPNQTYAPPYYIKDWQNPTPTDEFRFDGLKTASYPVKAGREQRYHLVRYDDTYDCEQYLLRSQGRLDVTAFAHSFETTYGNKHNTTVPGTDSNKNKFGGNMYTTVGGEYDLHIGACRYEQVDKDYELTVKGDVRADLKGDLTAVVKGNVSIAVNALTIEATEKITLKVGSSFIVIDHCAVYISGPSMVYINSGGSPDKAASVTMQNVADATLAEPGDKWNTRMTPCEHTPGGGGKRGTHTEDPTPAPDCDAVVGGVACGFLPVAGGGS